MSAPVKRDLPADIVDTLVELRSRDIPGEGLELDRFMIALHEAGWSLRAIGRALGVTGERIRQRTSRRTASERNFLPAVPPPPPIPKKVQARKPRRPRIRPEVVGRMQALLPIAQRARAGGNNTAARDAGRDLAWIMNELTKQGITAGQIAKSCGLTRGAVDSRLRRFGYKPVYASQSGRVTYEKRRPSTPPPSHCPHGHPMSGENLRIVGGNGPSAGTRVCRACERRRAKEYKQRQATAS